jgi:hypothetical protein
MTTSAGTLANFLIARIAESAEYWQARRPREIDRQSIDRVLADFEAKRRIVAKARTMAEMAAERPDDSFPSNAVAIYEGTMRDFAAAYADHPDYRDEWLP